MDLPHLIGRRASADFFLAMSSQKAHWYNIIAPSKSDPLSNEINRIFPPISSLLNIEATIMNRVLEKSSLCRRRGEVLFPVVQAWHDFITEYGIDVELTMFSIENKRRYFLRISSYNRSSHPAKMPIFYWRERNYFPPKLRINKLATIFAQHVGRMQAIFQVEDYSDMAVDFEDDDSSSDESTSMESSCDTKNVNGNEPSLRDPKVFDVYDSPDPTKFPLLHSLNFNPTTMDKLMQEILVYHGNKQITFTRGNNRKASLVLLPSHRHLANYEAEFSKKKSLIDTIIDIVAENTNNSTAEAAECLLKSFYTKFEDSFVNISIEKCLIKSKSEEKMDVISTEAMLQEANVSTNSARIINRHLRQHFGHSLFASEAERRRYFAGSDFRPTVLTKVLEDKTIIPYWYKRPDQYLQERLTDMIDPALIRDLVRVDIVIGGDHGGGKFRMTMKVNFRLPNKETISYLTQIASVSFSKDNIEILKETVLDPIGEGLRIIALGRSFIVLDNEYTVKFSLSDTTSSYSVHYSCPLQLYLVGDLKFYAQMSGREDMSSYWCMWCMLHPSEWRTFCDNCDSIPDEEKQLWTLDLHYKHLAHIRNNNIKQPKEIKGIVSEHVWDFIEPKHYIFPQLHFEIGVVNMVLDNFYAFLEDQIEVLSPEEKTARNSILIAEASLQESKNALEEWQSDTIFTLNNLRLQKSNISAALKRRTITVEERRNLLAEREITDGNITLMTDERKRMEKNLSYSRKLLGEKKKELKKIQSDKKKIDLPISAEIENILLKHNISAAAYHGGKLNGVDCRELIRLSKQIFSMFQDFLLTVEHPDRCSAEDIHKNCTVHSNICATLDTISSKVRMKYGEPNEEDFAVLEKALQNLDFLWKSAGLSYTPKVHGVLVHALDQIKECQGIGDMLEDDVEHIHQIAAKIEARITRMKDKTRQAFVHSKIEAIQNSQEIKAKVTESQQNAKRKFKKRNQELDSEQRNIKLKVERDSNRMETLKRLQDKPDSVLPTMKFKSAK